MMKTQVFVNSSTWVYLLNKLEAETVLLVFNTQLLFQLWKLAYCWQFTGDTKHMTN